MTTANELSMPRVTSHHVIINEGGGVNPSMILKDKDGWIVTGEVTPTKEAWVGKIDNNGKLLWKYTRSFPDKYTSDKKPVFDPDFSGGIIFDDGSSLLCGNVPKIVREPSSAFITKLDKNGKLVSENFISPPRERRNAPVRILSCTKWNESMIVVGYIGPEVPGKAGYDYWAHLINKDGKVTWSKIIKPIKTAPSPDSVDLKIIQNNFIFSGLSNRNYSPNTDVFLMDFKGNLISSYNTVGEYRMVQEESNDEVYLYGFPPSEKYELTNLIKLNSNLEEISRSKNIFNKGFYAHSIFRNSDGTFTGFGLTTHNDFSAYVGTVSHMSQDLSMHKILKILNDPYGDIGSIKVVVRGPSSNNFSIPMEILGDNQSGFSFHTITIDSTGK